MRNYRQAILKTLIYSSVFKYPLSRDQIWRYLIWEHKSKLKYSLFSQTLDTLVKDIKIFEINSLYLLQNKKSWIFTYNKEKKEGRKKLSIAKKTAFLLAFIPTIELIGLSGKLALGIASETDDIDLFFVTKKDSLWITRMLVLLFLSFVGIKRDPNSTSTKNRICANMFIDTTKLKIPVLEQDIFSAHEVVQLIPLVSKNNSYEIFLKENSWVKNYLPNSIKTTKTPKGKDIRIPGASLFEGIVYGLQTWYMKKKRTTENINKSYVRFHPNDARNWILKAYEQNLKTI